MRATLLVLLVAHGLAHLPGFFVPPGLTPTSSGGSAGLTNPGGRTRIAGAARLLGALWLVGAGAFFYAAFRWYGNPGALAPLVVATTFSLLLTAVWGRVARTGFYINVFILAALVGAGILAYRRDMRSAWTRVGSSTGSVQTSVGHVEYATAGAGAPVLVVHGTGGGFDQSLYASSDLVAGGFRLIAPSRFGYLGTPSRADASPALEARMFAELLDSIGVQRVGVISYSAGTAPAVQFALQYPHRVSALILAVPAAGGMVPVTHPNPPPKFMMQVALKYDLPMWLTWKLAPSMMYRLMGVPPRLVSTLSRADRADLDRGAMTLFPVSARYLGTLYDATTQSGSEPLYRLERLSAPTLLVSAQDDLYETLANARDMATRIPDARVLAVASGGHMLAGRRREIWPQVASFLEAANRRDARTH